MNKDICKNCKNGTITGLSNKGWETTCTKPINKDFKSYPGCFVSKEQVEVKNSIFEEFKDLCNYYKNRSPQSNNICREECPYYNCPTVNDCEEAFNEDRNVSVTRLDLLIETSELKHIIQKLITHLGVK